MLSPFVLANVVVALILIVIGSLIALIGPGTFKFWEWNTQSWEVLTTLLAGWALADFAYLTWRVQSGQAERDQLRFQLERSQAETQAFEGLIIDQSPAALISRGHIRAGGGFEGGQNIAVVSDEGTGFKTVFWTQAYSSPDYTLIVTPTRGRIEFEKTTSDVTIRSFDYYEELIDVDFDLLAIGSH